MTWDFSEKNLVYTSSFVEDTLAAKFRVRSMKDQMQVVLGRLVGDSTDLSGKQLENVSIELLSRGTDYSWLSCEVGGSQWAPFISTKRDLMRVYEIRANLDKPGVIIAPTRTNHPVIDFVFSSPSVDTSPLPVEAFQCTWHKDHPFTIRALYDLRRNLMKIRDTQELKIYLISPEKEADYQSKEKRRFMKSALPFVSFKWNKDLAVSATELQALWDNTSIHVLRPKDSWQSVIGGWLKKKS